VNDMEGVYLYDIDSLQSIAEQSLAQRRQQVSAAEKIIAEHVSDFAARIGGRKIEPPALNARALTSEL
jgi:glutamyl-tRNA reductase